MVVAGTERLENHISTGRHIRVNHNDRPGILHEHHRARDPLIGVAHRQDIESRRHADMMLLRRVPLSPENHHTGSRFREYRNSESC